MATFRTGIQHPTAINQRFLSCDENVTYPLCPTCKMVDQPQYQYLLKCNSLKKDRYKNHSPNLAWTANWYCNWYCIAAHVRSLRGGKKAPLKQLELKKTIRSKLNCETMVNIQPLAWEIPASHQLDYVIGLFTFAGLNIWKLEPLQAINAIKVDR